MHSWESFIANEIVSRLLRDAEFLRTKLDHVDGANGFGAHMVDTVKAKKIPCPPWGNSSVRAAR
jgi:hypothetical protein